MATKWSSPVFLKKIKDQLDATDAALPTSAEVSGTYVSSAYGAVTWVKSS